MSAKNVQVIKMYCSYTSGFVCLIIKAFINLLYLAIPASSAPVEIFCISVIAENLHRPESCSSSDALFQNLMFIIGVILIDLLTVTVNI